MKKDKPSSYITPRRGALAAIMVASFATITGVALAQDTTTQERATSTADSTTSTADPTTSTSDPTTTTDQTTSTSDSTDPSTDPGLTTTTSDELAVQTGATPRTSSSTINPNNCKETINGTTTQWQEVGAGTNLTTTVTYTDTNSVVITFIFTYNSDATAADWSSDVPFTGKILVKSANNPAIGTSFYTTDVVDATTGTLTTPATNQNNQPQAISHICLNGTGSTTTDTTTTDTTTTDTTTTDTTTTDTTTTDTTTGTTTGTTPVAGTTGAGGGAAGTVGGGGGGGDRAGDVAGAAAGEARVGGGGLPFTGFHAPLMVLVALAMGAAGLVLRKRLGDSA